MCISISSQCTPCVILISMTKLKSFYKSNKPFVIVAIIFILLGIIFNGKLTNLTHQGAQVIGIDSTTPPPYNQYPSLSNSGFYLETAVNSGQYYQALTGTKATMTETVGDIKALIGDYYASSCVSNSSDSCSGKRTTILNSLYTYAVYATAYNKLTHEMSSGAIINNNIDWAGISSSAIVMSLSKPMIVRNPPINSVDSFLAGISLDIQNKTNTAISSGSYSYVKPATVDNIANLSTFLQYKQPTLSADTTIKSVSLLNKEQNMAFVWGAAKVLTPTINTFTINGTTGTTVNQGSTVSIVWNSSDASNCYTHGATDTTWYGKVLPVSGTMTVTMGSSAEAFTLTCTSNTNVSVTNTVSVGVNTAKATQATVQTTQATTQTAQPATIQAVSAPVTQNASASVTPSTNITLTGAVPTTVTSGGTLTNPNPYQSTITINATPSPNQSTITLNGTPTTPIVGPLPPALYNTPYLFVFAPNALGNTDFKILNKASAGDAFAKYGKVNGSVGEITTTQSNLTDIATRVSADKLANANYSASVDNTILQPITCDPNAGDNSSASGADSPGTDCSSLNMVKITNQQQLNVLNKKISFYSSDYKTGYTSITSTLSSGNTFDIFFSKAKDDQAVGVVGVAGGVGNNFLESSVIQEGLSCATVVPIKSLNVQTKLNKSTTPFLDKFKGICGPLSTIRSLITTLKLPLPKGYPNPTYYSEDYKTTAWSKEFIEHILEKAGVQAKDGGLDQSQYLKLYQSYVGSSMNVVEIVFNPDLSPISLDDQKEISDLLKDSKTDCRLNTFAHSSHINKVYFSNTGNTFNIQVDDGLDQGSFSEALSDQYLMAPFYPGQTTFQLNKNGLVTRILNGGYPLKGWFTSLAIDYWNNKANFSKEFFVDCFTISPK